MFKVLVMVSLLYRQKETIARIGDFHGSRPGHFWLTITLGHYLRISLGVLCWCLDSFWFIVLRYSSVKSFVPKVQGRRESLRRTHKDLKQNEVRNKMGLARSLTGPSLKSPLSRQHSLIWYMELKIRLYFKGT